MPAKCITKVGNRLILEPVTPFNPQWREEVVGDLPEEFEAALLQRADLSRPQS